MPKGQSYCRCAQLEEETDPSPGGSLHCTAVYPFRKFLPSWASDWFRWVLRPNTVSKPALNSKRLLNSAVCRSNLALLSSLPGAGWAQRSLVLQQQSQSVWNLITGSWADTHCKEGATHPSPRPGIPVHLRYYWRNFSRQQRFGKCTSQNIFVFLHFH